MSPFKNSLLLLVVALAISASPSARGYHMSIANFLAPNADLSVHCASHTEDLGIHQVPYGSDFGWDFEINKPQKAHYECELISNSANRRGIFFMFDEATEAVRCAGSCMWRIKTDGLYLFLKDKGDYVFQYPWPTVV